MAGQVAKLELAEFCISKEVCTQKEHLSLHLWGHKIVEQQKITKGDKNTGYKSKLRHTSSVYV